MPSFPQGNIIYQQPWIDTGDLFASQNDINMFGQYAICYDDFTLTTTSSITNISWVGGYFNPDRQAPIQSWSVQIHADNGNQPGNVIASSVLAGTGGETFIGQFNSSPPNVAPALIYEYFVPFNFTALAGTKYWLSLVPSVGFPPEWGWAFGSGGDGIAYQGFFGTLSQIPTDLAFALYGAGGGTAPPAPGAYFKLQKLVVSVKQDRTPVRGRN